MSAGIGNTQEAPSSTNSTAYDLSNFKVLIIEDYHFIAHLLATSLKEIGIGKVFIAGSVTEGKKMLLETNAVKSFQNIDVLILDWLMPDGKGDMVLQWMRGHKSDAIKFLPVIICSAYASEEIVEEGRDKGANEIMVKPISAEKMAKRISYVIEKPRPYIKAPGFLGPDRRRKQKEFDGEDKRKLKPEEIVEHHEQFE